MPTKARLVLRFFLTHSRWLAGLLFVLALAPASISSWNHENEGSAHRSLEFGWIAGTLASRQVEGSGPIGEVVWDEPRWSVSPLSGAGVSLLLGILVLVSARRLNRKKGSSASTGSLWP